MQIGSVVFLIDLISYIGGCKLFSHFPTFSHLNNFFPSQHLLFIATYCECNKSNFFFFQLFTCQPLDYRYLIAKQCNTSAILLSIFLG